MSRGINKVFLIGNLGAEPEISATPSGNMIATMRVATSESWKDRNTGEQREKTEWHRVVIFGNLVEVVRQYVHKGSKVYLEGKVQTRKWQGQDGQDRYTTEVIIDSFNGQMQILDSLQEDKIKNTDIYTPLPDRSDQPENEPKPKYGSPTVMSDSGVQSSGNTTSAPGNTFETVDNIPFDDIPF